MAPIINVSNEILEHLKGLKVPYDLVETPKTAESQEQTAINYQINPSDFVILEGKSSGKDSYPDLWVCKYRLGASPAVENAGKRIDLNVSDTAQEKNNRDYIGNINREQALRLNLTLGGKTLNIRQAKDFLALLLSGKAFDGKGNKINKTELSQIAEEIIGRNSYRAEWYEDYFTGRDSLTLNKNYVLENDVLVPKYSNNLTTCLMEDRTPGIDLKNWLENSTAQGFPKKNLKYGNLWYWHPRENSAVWFDAYPDYASLDCSGDPQDTGARLGVRHVREAHAEK